jgi:hypothetical protein
VSVDNVWISEGTNITKQTDINYLNADGTPNLANIADRIPCEFYPPGVAEINGTNIADSGWALFMLMLTQVIWLQYYGGDRMYVASAPVTASGNGIIPATQSAVNVVNLGGTLA